MSDLHNSPSSIAFITNEDYGDMINNNNLLTFNFGKFGKTTQNNIIVDLYDYVNRNVNGVDDLYDDFLVDNEKE